MSKRSLTVVQNEASNEATINLYGIIGDYWEEDPLTAVRFLRTLALLEAKFDKINVRINSPGGNVWEGLAICNAIRASKKEIHTWNDGIAASMGAVILVSAKEGNRHAAKGSVTMVHSASTYAWGNAKDLREQAEALEVHDDALVSFFVDATSKTSQEIKAMWFDHSDHWLTAEQAAEQGLVSVEDYEIEQVPENVNNMSLQQVAALYSPNIKISNSQKENMFNNKFKALTALAKVAAGSVTAEQVQKINEEIEAEGIHDVTLVLDSELEKYQGFENRITDLEGEVSAKDTTISEKEDEIARLTNELAEANKKLKKPAAAAGAPGAAGKPDTQGEGKDDVNDYETSTDREAKALWG